VGLAQRGSGAETGATVLSENNEMEPKLPNAEPGKLEPEDYYFEGELMVFTEAYHLKRGSCCGSGCRHCPWRESAGRVEKAPEQE